MLMKDVFKKHNISQDSWLEEYEDLQVEFCGGRKTPNQGKVFCYRILNIYEEPTDDAILYYRHTRRLELKKNYFAERREYSAKIKTLSEKYDFTMGIGLALGLDEKYYKELKQLIDYIKKTYVDEFKDTELIVENLTREHSRTYQACILAEDAGTYELIEKIQNMSDKKNRRICHYLIRTFKTNNIDDINE